MSSTVFHNFRNAALVFLTPQCFDTYFLDFNFIDGPCFVATLSQIVGILIIIGSLIVKIPQGLKIYKNKSGKGISIISTTLDLSAGTFYMAYSFIKGFPFTAWGDVVSLASQTVLIVVLVFKYEGKLAHGIAYLIGYAVFCYILMSGITPISLLASLQTSNIFFGTSGKIMQAWTNYKNGNTGQLSAATLLILLGCTVGRIFTSIQETGDFIIILKFIAMSVVNAVLVFQLWWYWNVEGKVKKE